MIYSLLHARPSIEWILQQLMWWTTEDHGAPTLQVRTVQRSGKIRHRFKSSLELGARRNPAELHSSKSPGLPSRDWGYVHPWHAALCSVCVGCCSPLFFKLLPTTSWHLPSASTRIKSRVATASDLQHPLEGVQGGGQEWGPLHSGRNWQVFR